MERNSIGNSENTSNTHTLTQIKNTDNDRSQMTMNIL